MNIHKAFVRFHIVYVDIIYDKPENECFKDRLEKVQYIAALAITSAIRGTLREHIYNELGLVSIAEDDIKRLPSFIKL